NDSNAAHTSNHSVQAKSQTHASQLLTRAPGSATEKDVERTTAATPSASETYGNPRWARPTPRGSFRVALISRRRRPASHNPAQSRNTTGGRTNPAHSACPVKAEDCGSKGPPTVGCHGVYEMSSTPRARNRVAKAGAKTITSNRTCRPMWGRPEC